MQRWSASREASTEYGDVYVFCELEEDPTGDYVRYEDYKAALAEAERTIVELRGAAEADEQRLRDAAACAGVGWFGCDTPEVLADTIAELRAALRTKGESLDVCEAARVDGLYREAFLLDERDEARRVAVWAVKHGASAGWDGDSWPAIWYATSAPSTQTRDGERVTSIQYDGTDESLIETLCKLAEGE